MTDRKITDPLAALAWMRDTPHWIGAAVPSRKPRAMRLSGLRDGTPAALIPSSTLQAMEGLYEVAPDVHNMAERKRTTWRMYVPTPLGKAALELQQVGAVFELGLEETWAWRHARRLEFGFGTLADAVRSAGACVPRKTA